MTAWDLLWFGITLYWKIYLGLALLIGGPAFCVWLAGHVKGDAETLCGVAGFLFVLSGIVIVIGEWQW